MTNNYNNDDELRIIHDDKAKHLLSHKSILAKVLHDTVEEFKDIPIDVIKEECID